MFIASIIVRAGRATLEFHDFDIIPVRITPALGVPGEGLVDLTAETLEFTKYIFRFVAVFFFLGAVTLDLLLLFRAAQRENYFNCTALSQLRQRKITLGAVVLTLIATIYFTVPRELSDPASPEKIPQLYTMVVGATLYLLTALLLFCFTAFTSDQNRVSLTILFNPARTPFTKAAKKGLLYGIAAIPPTLLMTVIANELIVYFGLETESQPVIQWLINEETTAISKVAIFLSAVIAAPIAEELIFRGILFPAVYKKRSWFFAAMLSGCIFSLIHFHPPSFLSIFTLSICFCGGYAVTGSLVTPIVMHMVFNASAMFFALLI